MKIAHFILSAVGVVISAAPGFAQRFAPPEGEIVVHHESYDDEGIHGQSIVTSRHIYDRWTDNKGVYGATLQEFEAPEGRSIVSAERKDGIYVLLLDNGDVWKYGLHPGRVEGDQIYLPVRYNFKVGSGGSETFKKIVGDDMYALSSYSLYVSRDGLATWQVDTTGLGSSRVNAIVVDSDQNVYAATPRGLYVQGPKDTVWVLRGLASNVGYVYVDRHNRLYRSIDTTLEFSTDGGNNWSNVSNPTSQQTTSIAQDFSGDLYAAGAGGLFRSAAGVSTGLTAQLLSAASEPPSGSQLVILNVDADSIVSVSTNFGTFESRDHGASWYAVDYGIPAEHLYGLVHTASGAFVTSTSLGVFRTTGLGNPWTRSQNVLKGSGIQLFRAAGVLYAYRPAAPKFWTSSDDGVSWDSIPTGGLDLGGIAVDEAGVVHGFSSKYGSSFTGYLYSWTSATGWKYDTNGFTPTHYSYGGAMTSDGHGTLYASGSFPGGAKVMARPVAGGAWVPDTAGIGGAINYFTMFATGPDLYGATSNAILQRMRSGWSPIPLPLPLPGRVTHIAELADSALFASFMTSDGAGAGIFFTKDQGETWTFVGYGDLETFGLIPDGSGMYATTDHGIYPLSETAGQFQLHVDPQTIDFGDVRVGDSFTKVLTVATTGARTPHFTAFSVPDPNFITGQVPEYLVGPDSVNLVVTFKPTSLGLHQAIGSLAFSGIPLTFSVKGTGSGAGVLDPTRSTSCSVYPNPLVAPAILHLSSTEAVSRTTVVDALGERVLDVNGSTDRLDFSALPAGVYIVEVIAGDIITRRLVDYTK